MKEGDCMSVPNDYFGNDYLPALQTIGVVEDCLYGMVVQHINGTQLFVEGNETKNSLDKVTIKPIDTLSSDTSGYSRVINKSRHIHPINNETDLSPQPKSESLVLLFVVSNQT